MHRLKIHERTTAAGSLSSVYLVCEDGTLAMDAGDGVLALPEGAMAAVFGRFGAPLDPASRLAYVASLDVGAGRVVRHVRHLARFDVIARDYLVYEREGEEPTCALAVTVAGALEYLARAVR